MKILRQFCLFGLTAFTLRACEGQNVVRRPAYEWLHLLHDLMGVHIIAPSAQDAPVSTNALIFLALTPCRPFKAVSQHFPFFLPAGLLWPRQENQDNVAAENMKTTRGAIPATPAGTWCPCECKTIKRNVPRLLLEDSTDAGFTSRLKVVATFVDNARDVGRCTGDSECLSQSDRPYYSLRLSALRHYCGEWKVARVLANASGALRYSPVEAAQRRECAGGVNDRKRTQDQLSPEVWSYSGSFVCYR